MTVDCLYRVLLADPPWQYRDTRNHDPAFGAMTYPTMSTDDICALPFADKAADDAVLYLWVTPPFLPDALRVIDAWGFTFKTVGFTWVKLNKNGRPFFGIGHYTKSNAEYCLLAVRGRGVEVVDNTISQVVLSVRGRHSEKPKEVYAKIERLHGAQPRVELFARHRRAGWDAWGNEVPSEEQEVLGASS